MSQVRKILPQLAQSIQDRIDVATGTLGQMGFILLVLSPGDTNTVGEFISSIRAEDVPMVLREAAMQFERGTPNAPIV